MKFSFLAGPEKPQVQLYGKLPLAKDYLRVGCGDGAGRELREWLDGAFGTQRAAAAQPVLGEPLCFLGQGEKEPLQGCLWPSSDAGGLRAFPFALFVARRRKALLADLERDLAGAESVWRALAETRERCLAATDGAALLDGERGRELEIDAEPEMPGEPVEFDAWIAALWPAQGLDGLFALFERLGALARERHAGPCRLPLVRELSGRDQVVAWTALLRQLGALAADEVPTVFFPPRSLVPSSEAAYAVFARRPLAADEVVWLTPAGEQPLGAADFARSDEAAVAAATSSTGRTPLGAGLRDALASFGARNR